MHMFKKNGGFTLVELIVVIAILAILAGVAVPAYSGYIDRANEAADIVTCDAVKTAVFAAYAENGLDMPQKIVVADGSVTVAATADGTAAAMASDVQSAFAVYYGSTVAINGATATWTSTTNEWDIT